MKSLKRFHHMMAAVVCATLLLSALALAAFMTLFPPQFRGWYEQVGAQAEIGGWIVNERDPAERVAVRLYLDGRFIAEKRAELPRPDVVVAGFTQDERCGYRFLLPDLAPGIYTARVYAVHKLVGNLRTLQPTGQPVRMTIQRQESAGNSRAIAASSR